MRRVVFLDRDGVINFDSPEYIKSPDEFCFIPGSIDAISLLNGNGWNIIIITNQSAVERGMITVDDLERIHEKMHSGVRGGGGKITDIFYCPHLPERRCLCRKPNPGMIKAAERKYQLDLSMTVMIGDSLKDIDCGQQAGCGMTVLIKSGALKKEPFPSTVREVMPDRIFPSLYSAAEWIVHHL